MIRKWGKGVLHDKIDYVCIPQCDVSFDLWVGFA